jgi:hypothetical protein
MAVAQLQEQYRRQFVHQVYINHEIVGLPIWIAQARVYR